jgi:hypothetical protein
MLTLLCGTNYSNISMDSEKVTVGKRLSIGYTLVTNITMDSDTQNPPELPFLAILHGTEILAVKWSLW